MVRSSRFRKIDR